MKRNKKEIGTNSELNGFRKVRDGSLLDGVIDEEAEKAVFLEWTAEIDFHCENV